jgi:uncharacterized protein (TIGR02594 family)
MVELPWIKEARKLIGTHEGVGPKDNSTVVQLFVDAGHPEIKHDEVPWCAGFVGACLHRAGVKGTGSLLALSYRLWGTELANPVYGCVATKTRKGGGHVFFVVGYDPKTRTVYGLGGNQNDQVSIARFKRSELKFRWPANMPVTKVPLPTTMEAASNVKES